MKIALFGGPCTDLDLDLPDKLPMLRFPLPTPIALQMSGVPQNLPTLSYASYRLVNVLYGVAIYEFEKIS